MPTRRFAGGLFTKFTKFIGRSDPSARISTGTLERRKTMSHRTLSLLLLTFLSASLHASSGGYVFVAPADRFGPASMAQAGPQIASDGFDFLAVWTTQARMQQHVYATRIDGDGTVRGSLPVLLDAFGSTAWGASLSKGRDGYFSSWLSDDGIEVATIDAFGNVLHRNTHQPEQQPAAATTLTAWSGTSHAVLTVDSRAVSAVVFDNGLNKLTELITLQAGTSPSAVAVVSDAKGFVVVTSKPEPDSYSSGELWIQRITPNGVPSTPVLLRGTADYASSLAAVSTPAGIFLAWADRYGVWTMTFDPENPATARSRQLLSGTGAVVTGATLHGTEFFVAYNVNSEAWTQAITPDLAFGTPVRAIGITSGVLASNGSRLAHLHQVYRSVWDDNDVFLEFVAPKTSDAVLVSRSAADQRSIAVSASSDFLLGAWDEEIDHARQVFVTRMAPDRTIADPQSTLLSTGGFNTFPSASWNGAEWLVVWTRTTPGGTSVVGRRVSRDGRAVEGSEFVIGDGGTGTTTRARVTSNDTEWFVVWNKGIMGSSCGNHVVASRAMGARVSSRGTVLDPGGVLLAPGNRFDEEDVNVAWNGTEYVAAWRNLCWGFHQPTSGSIGAAFITPDLSTMQVTQLSDSTSTTQQTGTLMPRVAGANGKTFVSWMQWSGTTMTTRYRVVESSDFGRARRRSSGVSQQPGVVDGELVAVGANGDQTFSIMTRKAIGWAVGDGLFETKITFYGAVTGDPRYSVYIDRPTFFSDMLTPFAGTRWIGFGRFEPWLGSERVAFLDAGP